MGKANRQRRRMKEKERKRTPPTSAREEWWMPIDQPTLQERAALDGVASNDQNLWMALGPVT